MSLLTDQHNQTPRQTAEALLAACVDYRAMVDKLERENAALRNEVARLNGQTQWQCTCGGTDCAGQRENRRLRIALSRVRHYVDHSPDLSQAARLERVGETIDYVIGKEAQP